MSDWVELSKIAVRPRYSCALSVTALLVIFVEFPDKFMIQKIKNEYGEWIGLVAIFFIVVYLIELSILCSEKVVRFYETYNKKMERKATFQSLNVSEKAILAKYLEKNESTIELPRDKPEVASLVHKEILDQIKSNSSFGTPYNVRPDAWKYMLKNKDQFIRRMNPQGSPC